MCCPQPVDPIQFSLQETNLTKVGKEHVHVKGRINPLSVLSLGVLEKLAELADQIYHLFASIILPYVNAAVKQMASELHHSIHLIEYVLHAFCLIEDIKHLVYCIRKRDFFVYVDKERTKINYLHLAGRISHGVAHLFATANFLSDLNLLPLGGFRRVVKCASLIAAFAHALLTASVVCYQTWYSRLPGESIHQNPQLSQFSIHASGFLFEALPWMERISIFVPYAGAIQKITALVGIVHAWFVINQGQMIEARGAIKSHSHCKDH